jgi:hypothetical protein
MIGPKIGRWHWYISLNSFLSCLKKLFLVQRLGKVDVTIVLARFGELTKSGKRAFPQNGKQAITLG